MLSLYFYADVRFRWKGFVSIFPLLNKISLHFFGIIATSIEANNIANNGKTFSLIDQLLSVINP